MGQNDQVIYLSISEDLAFTPTFTIPLQENDTLGVQRMKLPLSRNQGEVLGLF